MQWAAAVFAICGVGCGRLHFDPTSQDAPAGDTQAACVFGPFGTPVTDPILNSGFIDWGPSLSADGLTLVFASARGGGNDRIYTSSRSSVGAAWSTPVEITEIAPGATAEDPSLSTDQLSLYWGSPAIQLAQRATRQSAWVTVADPLLGEASHQVNGGPDISPDGLTLVVTGVRTSDGTNQMYEAKRLTEQDSFTTSTQIPGITNGAEFGSYRGDGLEVIFQRAGTNQDLVHATRASNADPFGPVTPILELDSPLEEGDPDLSNDGTTVWFASRRAGGLGNYDLWSATRSCL